MAHSHYLSDDRRITPPKPLSLRNRGVGQDRPHY